MFVSSAMFDEGIWIVLGRLVDFVAAASSFFFKRLPDVAFELATLRFGDGLTMSNAIDKPRGVLVALSSAMNPIDDLQVLFLL